MVDASGDIAVGDPPPGERGWRIGIAPLDEKPRGASKPQPARFVWLTRCAISTAGDAAQFVELGGVRYLHIVDPRTGLGLTDHASVTVVAPDCITADSLDTAINVLGPERGLTLAEKTPDAAVLILRQTGDRIEEFVSPRMKQLLAVSAEAKP